MRRTLVIIPAYNEESSIAQVIDQVKTYFSQGDILVVNDGSTDLTSKRARAGGALVLDLPFNLGIGGAMQAGYKYAYEKGIDIAVQVDGDGQHDPREIPKLLLALGEKEADLVIGTRFMRPTGYRSPAMRRLGISIISNFISVLVGQRVTDSTSGFRAAGRRAIRLFAFDYPQDYPEPEVLLLLKKAGLKMVEVPVEMSQRVSGESSITKARSIYYMVKVLLAISVDCFKTQSLSSQEDEPC
jgi:glycosyltransferase involved in cell wall biosynthesis